MTVLVTGAAGFIGSQLCAELLGLGMEVTGLDNFDSFYDPARKRGNITILGEYAGFSFIEADMTAIDLARLMRTLGTTRVYHLAGLPGVRESWARPAHYVSGNVLTTLALLRAYERIDDVPQTVVASSSAVYGACAACPSAEDDVAIPTTPYGAAKLAMEHLVQLYVRANQWPIMVARLFSVYGPGQRPDMLVYRAIGAALAESQVNVYGTGQQVRDFTYVTDAIAGLATIIEHGEMGRVYNVAGGSCITVNHVVNQIGEMLGKAGLAAHGVSMVHGEMQETHGDTSRLRALGWASSTKLPEGLKSQIEWQRALTC